MPPSDGAFRNPVTSTTELKDEDKAKNCGPLYEKTRLEHQLLMLVQMKTAESESGSTDHSSLLTTATETALIPPPASPTTPNLTFT